MTETEYRVALRLLDSATSLLHREPARWDTAARRELRRLALEFDLLRLRLTQTPAESRRN